MTRALLGAALLIAVVTRLEAQAPRITPAGDPSIKNDTIYRLAVNPADHPGEDYVFLLDDGVVRFDADGKSSRTYRQVVQVLTQQGVEDWGEQSFSYSSSRERLTVNWIRVLKPTGEVISAQPAHEQESLAEVALEAPVYSDEKVRRVTLAGVAPGTLVDWSYTVEKFAPVLAGDFSSAWRVRMGTMARRSRFLVDAPANVTPRIEEENFHYTKRVTDAGGRRVYLWAAAEVPKLEGELFGASPNTLSVHIDVAAPLAWADIARWYAGLSKDRYALSPQLETKLAEVVAGARTLEDSLRAVHRWVAQDFRYVSLSLGIGGYQPRRPADVLETKYGDCKDKATLFIALARRMGLRADPVLLSASGGVDTLLPSLSQFDHMIAAVAKPSGGYTFFDLTSEFTPYGQLPPAEQGEFGLIVHADGRGESVTLPEDSASVNRATVTLVGTLSADGVFAGRYTEVTEGAQQYGLRGAYARKFSREQSDRVTQAIANAIAPGAAGDSLETFDGNDLRAEPRVSVVIHDAHLTSSSGGTEILNLPGSLPTFNLLSLASRLDARRPRLFPIDIAAVLGPIVKSAELRVTLPEGWHARLPAAIAETSEFGSYHASYTQTGRELRIVREISGRQGTAPADHVNALIAWLRAVSKDDVRYIVLEHGH